MITLVLACWFATAGMAQENISFGTNYYDDDAKGVIYDREFTVDLKLHTFGYALGVNFGRLRTYYLTRYFNIEFGELKHPKEFRQSLEFALPGTARAFIFGKQNNFFVLRGGIGEKRYLSEKAKKKGVAIALSYSGGVALGMLKPYYLDLFRQTDPPSNQFFISSEKYSEENRDVFLTQGLIYGSSGFARGLGEIRFVPGGQAKFGVNFDWGAFDEFAKSLEAGVMIDFFFQKVPIMIEDPEFVPNTENRFLFVNFFVNLQFGKRWYN